MREVDRLIARAASRHRAGSNAEAERLYLAALALEPVHPDALHGLGCLAHEAGQPGRAIGLIGQAVAAAPEIAHYMISLGLALLAQGHHEEARAALQVAVLRDPEDARAHRALAQALQRLGRTAEAQQSLLVAIELDPAEAASHLALGASHRSLGAIDAAITAFAHATKLAPMNPLAWHSLGAACGQTGRAAEAEAAFREVVALLPEDAAARANLGTALFTRGELEPAHAELRQAVALAPGNPQTASSLGLVLLGLGETLEAERVLAEASAMAPGSDAIAVNHATALYSLERRTQAEALLQAVLVRDPVNLHARFNRATLQLARGALPEGWADFEARLELGPLVSSSRLPSWDGAMLTQGTVLVRGEQGLGDAIMFLRWVPMAAARAALILELPSSLHRLVAAMGLTGERVRILAPGQSVEECVAEISLLSLPHVLSAPQPPPILFPRSISGDEAASGVMQVGLAWKGSPSYQFDRMRSIPLSQLEPLAQTGASFVSLQVGQAAKLGKAALPGLPQGADLLDTAERIARLDLVISVDTAVAHLAGTMGKPVWLLDRFGGDWRWGAGFDYGAVWYPTLRRFAPISASGSWSETVGEICRELNRLRDAPLPTRS